MPPKTLTQAQLEHILRKAGWSERLVPIMSAIGMAESSGNVGAYNPGVGHGGRPTKEQSIGPWQINMLPSLNRPYDRQRLATDPVYNAQVAKEIYSAQGLKAWGAYTDGRYRKYYKGTPLPDEEFDGDTQGDIGPPPQLPPLKIEQVLPQDKLDSVYQNVAQSTDSYAQKLGMRPALSPLIESVPQVSAGDESHNGVKAVPPLNSIKPLPKVGKNVPTAPISQQDTSQPVVDNTQSVENSDDVQILPDDYTTGIDFRSKPDSVPASEFALRALIPDIARRLKMEPADVEKELRVRGIVQLADGTPVPDNFKGVTNFSITPDFADAVARRAIEKRDQLRGLIASGQTFDSNEISQQLGIDPQEINNALSGKDDQYFDAVREREVNTARYEQQLRRYQTSYNPDEPITTAEIRAARDMGWITPEKAEAAIRNEKELQRQIMNEDRDWYMMSQYSGQESPQELEKRIRDYSQSKIEGILSRYRNLQSYAADEKRQKEGGFVGLIDESIKSAGRYVAKLPATAMELGAVAETQTVGWANNDPKGSELVKYLMDGAKSWRESIDSHEPFKQKEGYKHNFIVNEFSEGFSQILVQTILAPITGGASILLPLAEGGTAQFREAREAGAGKGTQLAAFTVGAALGVPEVLLHAKYLRNFVKPSSVINKLYEATWGKVSKFFPKAEAEAITRRSITGFFQEVAKEAPKNAIGEYSQEAIEDLGNKFFKNATYNPDVKWQDVFTGKDSDPLQAKKYVPSEEEQRGYAAAGIVGIFGGNLEAATTVLSTSELKSAYASLPEMLAKGRYSQAYADKVAKIITAELANRKIDVTGTPLTQDQIAKSAKDQFALTPSDKKQIAADRRALDKFQASIANGDVVQTPEGEGRVLQSRGKNWLIEYNPTVNSKGETTYQSVKQFRKDKIRPLETPEAPIESEQSANDLGVEENLPDNLQLKAPKEIKPPTPAIPQPDLEGISEVKGQVDKFLENKKPPVVDLASLYPKPKPVDTELNKKEIREKVELNKAWQGLRKTPDIKVLAKWVVDNSQIGDEIRHPDGSKYVITQRKTLKNGKQEIVLENFDEKGNAVNGNIQIITVKPDGSITTSLNGSIIANSYTDSNGKRGEEVTTYVRPNGQTKENIEIPSQPAPLETETLVSDKVDKGEDVTTRLTAAVRDVVDTIPEGVIGRGALNKVADELTQETDPLKLLTAIQRGRTRIANMPKSPEVAKALTPLFDEIQQALQEQGYEVQDLVGKKFDIGMNLGATFVEDNNVPVGQEIIIEVIKPAISKDGQQVQAAEVLVGKNYSESTEAKAERKAAEQKAEEEARQRKKKEMFPDLQSSESRTSQTDVTPAISTPVSDVAKDTKATTSRKEKAKKLFPEKDANIQAEIAQPKDETKVPSQPASLETKPLVQDQLPEVPVASKTEVKKPVATTKKPPPLKPTLKPATAEEIHAVAKEKGVDVNSPVFHKLSKDLVGVAKLDHMSPMQLTKVREGIKAGRFDHAKIAKPVEKIKYKENDRVITQNGTFGIVEKLDDDGKHIWIFDPESDKTSKHLISTISSENDPKFHKAMLDMFLAKNENNKNFREFFKGSKAVDFRGNPVIYFHGGFQFEGPAFNARKTSDFGFHFGNRDQANARAKKISSSETGIAFRDTELIPAVIQARRPLRLRDEGHWSNKIVFDQAVHAGALDQSQFKEIFGENAKDDVTFITGDYTYKESEERLKRALEKAGYDSIVYTNEYETDVFNDSYILFRPEQIKSIYNNGDYSSDARFHKAAADKILQLGAEGTSAQWINRNENTIKDWNKYLKSTTKGKVLSPGGVYEGGLGELATEVDKVFKEKSSAEKIKEVSTVDLTDYLQKMADANAEVNNPDIAAAVAGFRRDPKESTDRINKIIADNRTESLQEWKDYLTKGNPIYAKDPFFRDWVWNDVIKLRENRPDLPIGLDKAALASVYDDVKNNPNSSAFQKLYERKVQELMLKDAETNEILKVEDGTWIKIPQTPRDHPDFKKNVSKVQAVSRKEWCTSQGMAEAYLPMGSFWVLVKNNKSELAFRFSGDAVAEIQGKENNGTIPEEFLEDIKDLIRAKNEDGSEKVPLTISSMDQILRALRESKFKAKLVPFIEERTKLYDEYNHHENSTINPAPIPENAARARSIVEDAKSSKKGWLKESRENWDKEDQEFWQKGTDLFLKHFDPEYKEPKKEKKTEERDYFKEWREATKEANALYDKLPENLQKVLESDVSYANDLSSWTEAEEYGDNRNGGIGDVENRNLWIEHGFPTFNEAAKLTQAERDEITEFLGKQYDILAKVALDYLEHLHKSRKAELDKELSDVPLEIKQAYKAYKAVILDPKNEYLSIWHQTLENDPVTSNNEIFQDIIGDVSFQVNAELTVSQYSKLEDEIRDRIDNWAIDSFNKKKSELIAEVDPRLDFNPDYRQAVDTYLGLLEAGDYEIQEIENPADLAEEIQHYLREKSIDEMGRDYIEHDIDEILDNPSFPKAWTYYQDELKALRDKKKGELNKELEPEEFSFDKEYEKLVDTYGKDVVKKAINLVHYDSDLPESEYDAQDLTQKQIDKLNDFKSSPEHWDKVLDDYLSGRGNYNDIERREFIKDHRKEITKAAHEYFTLHRKDTINNFNDVKNELQEEFSDDAESSRALEYPLTLSKEYQQALEEIYDRYSDKRESLKKAVDRFIDLFKTRNRAAEEFGVFDTRGELDSHALDYIEETLQAYATQDYTTLRQEERQYLYNGIQDLAFELEEWFINNWEQYSKELKADLNKELNSDIPELSKKLFPDSELYRFLELELPDDTKDWATAKERMLTAPGEYYLTSVDWTQEYEDKYQDALDKDLIKRIKEFDPDKYAKKIADELDKELNDELNDDRFQRASVNYQELVRLKSEDLDDKFIAKITSKVDKDGNLEISPAAAELIRRVEMLHTGEDSDPFLGGMLRSNQLKLYIPPLRGILAKAPKEYTKKDLKPLRDLVNNLATAYAKKSAVIYIDKSKVPHEMVHKLRYQFSGFKERVSEYYKTFSKVFSTLEEIEKRAFDNYFRYSYFNGKRFSQLTPADQEFLHEELIAHILDGDYGKLGLTDKQAARVISVDTKAYLEKNGDDVIDELQRWIDENQKQSVLEHKSRKNVSKTDKSTKSGRGKSGTRSVKTDETGPGPNPPDDGNPPGVEAEDERNVTPRAYPINAQANTQLNPEDLHFDSQFYTPQSREGNHEIARQWLEERGIANAVNELYDLPVNAITTAKRQAVLSYLDAQVHHFMLQGNTERARAVYDQMVGIANTISPEYTEWGQAISQLAYWQSLDPEAIVNVVENKRARRGKKRGTLDLQTQEKLRAEAAEIETLNREIDELEDVIRGNSRHIWQGLLRETEKLRYNAIDVLRNALGVTKDTANKILKAIDTLHGTKTIFPSPAYSEKHVATNDGIAFGWGIYSTQSEKVARWYRNPDNDSRAPVKYQGHDLESLRDLAFAPADENGTPDDNWIKYSAAYTIASSMQFGSTLKESVKFWIKEERDGIKYKNERINDLNDHVHSLETDALLNGNVLSQRTRERISDTESQIQLIGAQIDQSLKLIEAYKALKEKDFKRDPLPGAVYKNKIDGEIYHFLRWDLPFEKQSDFIKEVVNNWAKENEKDIKRFTNEGKLAKSPNRVEHYNELIARAKVIQKAIETFINSNPNTVGALGAHFYNSMPSTAAVISHVDRARDKSKLLLSRGILGNSYLIAADRGKESGELNFVNFSAEHIQIVDMFRAAADKRLDISALEPAVRQAALQIGKEKYLAGKVAGGQTLNDWKSSLRNELSQNSIEPTAFEPYMDSLYVAVREEVKTAARAKELDRVKKKFGFTDNEKALEKLSQLKAEQAAKLSLEAKNLREAKGIGPRKTLFETALDNEFSNLEGNELEEAKNDIRLVKDRNAFYTYWNKKGLSAKEITARYVDAIDHFININEELKSGQKTRKMEKELNAKISDLTPEEVDAYEKALHDKKKVRNRKMSDFRATIKHLTDRPETPKKRLSDWYLRVNRAGETMLTAALATVLHNIIAQRGVKLLHTFETAGELAILKLENYLGKDLFTKDPTDINIATKFSDMFLEELYSTSFPATRYAWKQYRDKKAGLLAALSLVVAHKQKVIEGVLAHNPDLYEDMYAKYSYGEDVLHKFPIDDSYGPIEAKIERGVRGVESWTHFWTTLNRLQENHFKSATFLGVLTVELKARGIDPDEVIVHGKIEGLDRAILEKAVNRAAEDTFSQDIPKTNEAYRAINSLSNFAKWVPYPLNPVLFRRFLFNSTSYMVEHSPLILAKAAGPGVTARDFSKCLVGFGIFSFAVAMLSNFGSDDDDPLTLTFFGTTYKMTAYNPLSTFLILASILTRASKGKKPLKSVDELWKIFGVDTRYPNLAMEWFESLADLVSSEEDKKYVKFNELNKQVAGRGLTAYFKAFATLKAVQESFDSQEATIRDYGREPFTGELKKNFPLSEAVTKLITGSNTKVREDALTGEPMEKILPWLNQMGVSIVPEKQIGPKFTAAEEYLDVELRKMREKNVKFYKDPKQRTASGITAQLFTALDKGVNSDLIIKRAGIYLRNNEISQNQYDNIVSSSKNPSKLGRKAEDAPIPMLIRAMKYATPSEFKSLKTVLETKALNQAKRNSLSPEELELLRIFFGK